MNAFVLPGIFAACASEARKHGLSSMPYAKFQGICMLAGIILGGSTWQTYLLTLQPHWGGPVFGRQAVHFGVEAFRKTNANFTEETLASLFPNQVYGTTKTIE